VCFLCVGFGAAPDEPISLNHLLFSLDGRYLLAQDDRSVTILTVRPLAVSFRIPARGASPAHFTPDSRQAAAEVSPGVVGLYERGKGLQATVDLRAAR